MTIKPKFNVKPPPGATRGRAVVDPKTGDKRIRLSELAARPSENETELTLYQILRGEIKVEGNEDTVVRLKPLTLDGLAILEEAYADEGGLAVLSRRPATTRDYIRIAAILHNDGAPDDKQLTEKQIAKAIDARLMGVISRLMNEVITGPLEAAAAQLPTAADLAAAGLGSSTGAPSGTGGSHSK